MKKFISILLSSVMLLSFVSTVSYAEQLPTESANTEVAAEAETEKTAVDSQQTPSLISEEEKELVKISTLVPPKKSSYKVSEVEVFGSDFYAHISVDGLVIKCEYSDGSTDTVNVYGYGEGEDSAPLKDFEYTAANKIETGNNKVEYTYKGFTASFNIQLIDDRQDDCADITCGETEVTFEKGQNTKVFKFVPEKTAVYSAASLAEGGHSVIIYVYNSKREPLSESYGSIIINEDTDISDIENIYELLENYSDFSCLAYLEKGKEYYISVSSDEPVKDESLSLELSPVSNIKLNLENEIVFTQYLDLTPCNDSKENYDFYDILDVGLFTAQITTQNGKTTKYIANAFDNLKIISDQSATNIWTPGTHSFTVDLCGFKEQFSATVKPASIKSISAKMLTPLVYGVDSLYTEDDSGEWTHLFFIKEEKISLTLTYTNGKKETFEGEEIYDLFELFQDYRGNIITFTDNQSAKNPWLPGNTYTTAVSYLGFKCNMNVKIIDNDVKEIKAVYKSFLIENCDGFWSYYLTEKEEKVHEFFCYQYDGQYIELTVTYKDGSQVTYTGYEYLDLDGVSCTDEQDYFRQWSAGSDNNTVTLRYSGKVTTFNIPIKKTPVTDIVITSPFKSTYVQGADCELIFNDELGKISQYYAIDFTGFKFDVHFEDGSVFSYDYDYLCKISDGQSEPTEEDISYYKYQLSDNMEELQKNNELTEGEYSLKMIFMGFEFSQKFTIVPSPVESIELISAPDRTDYYLGCDVDPYTSSYYTVYDNEVNRNYLNGLQVKINYKDSTSKVYSYDAEYQNLIFEDRDLLLYSSQDFGEMWEKEGTYPVTVYYMGATTSYNINLLKNPVKSIKVKKLPDKLRYYEFIDCYWLYDEDENEYPCYNINPLGMEVEIEFNDGSAKSVTFDSAYKEIDGYPVEVYSPQDSSLYWEEQDTYPVTVSYMGNDTQYNVELVESPVCDIIINKPSTLPEIKEHHGGFFTYDSDGNECYYYYPDLSALELTIIYNDGKQEVVKYSELQDGYYNGYPILALTYQAYEPWTAGNSYEIDIEYMGASSSISVNIAHTWEKDKVVEMTPSSVGYTVYKCSECSIEKKGEFMIPDVTGLELIGGKGNTATLKWNEINGVAGYEIYDRGKLIAIVKGNSFKITNADPNAVYTVKGTMFYNDFKYENPVSKSPTKGAGTASSASVKNAEAASKTGEGLLLAAMSICLAAATAGIAFTTIKRKKDK